MNESQVGVIGCGMLAQFAHLPNLKQIEGINLRWACDIDRETLKSVQEKYAPEKVTQDYRDVMEDPAVDAIVLATAQELRKPVIAAAARAGKAVYCEKPMADTLEEMQEIAEIVDRSGIVFTVGHNRRSAPAMKYFHDLFQTHRSSPNECPWRFDRNSMLREHWPEEDQSYVVIRINDDLLSWKQWAVAENAMVGGPMLFEMTHFTDLACWFLKSRPVSVTAVGHHRANQTVVIMYEDGSMASILMAGVGTFGYPKELYEVYFDGAAIINDHCVEVRTAGLEGVPNRTDFPLRFDPHPEVSDGGGIRDFYAKRRNAEVLGMGAHDPLKVFEHDPVPEKGHKAHLSAFLDAVRGSGETPCSCHESITATRLAFAAIESLRTGKSVSV